MVTDIVIVMNIVHMSLRLIVMNIVHMSLRFFI